MRSRGYVVLCLALFVTSCTNGPGSSPVPAASKSPAAITVGDYASMLSGLSSQLKAQLARVQHAKDLQSLESDFGQIGSTITTGADRLGQIVPPASAATGATALLGALRTLATQVDALKTSVQTQQYCTGTSAAAAMRRLGAVASLTSAEQELAQQGVTFSDMAPPRVREKPTRLRNGQFLIDRRNGSRGGLTIKNTYHTGGIVSLMRGNAALLTVYVSPHASTTFSGIPDGSYRVFTQQGEYWDPKAKMFGRDCSFWRAPSNIDYRTSVQTSSHIANVGMFLVGYTTTTVYWKNWTIQLGHSKGKTRYKEISPSRYPKGAA